MLQRVLFGPQSPVRNLGQAFTDGTIPGGPVGVISAGWQEAEGDFEELGELVPRPLVNIDLYRRAEQVFEQDRHFRSAYRQRQDRLQSLQRLYRLRLRQLVMAARRVRRTDEPGDLVAAEARHAIAQLRALDRHHLKRIAGIYSEFADRLSPQRCELLATHIDAIDAMLSDCATVLVTGGNVLVLLNRLQLFGLRDALAIRHLVAWSAGAMVLASRVVLFHDSKPLGRRDAEVLGAGMGLIPAHVFLPDAARRLRERDAAQIRLFAGRFSPDRCLTLDSGSQLQFLDQRLYAAHAVYQLTSRGAVSRLGAL